MGIIESPPNDLIYIYETDYGLEIKTPLEFVLM